MITVSLVHFWFLLNIQSFMSHKLTLQSPITCISLPDAAFLLIVNLYTLTINTAPYDKPKET
jgi:hypothetical protein